MKDRLKIWTPVIALVLAAVLFAGGAVGAANAALTYYSDNYDLDIEVPCIGVTLEENGRAVAWRDYLSGGRESSGSRGLLGDIGNITPGTYYDEALTVRNSGDVDSYVKVVVYKYWTDSRGNKITALEPDQIVFDLGTGANWFIDEEASTAERTVLYYAMPLEPDQRTTALSDSIMMAANVTEQVSQRTVKSDENGKTIAVEYAYDGVRMYVEAEVFAVQAHNAELSIKSAWGKTVSASSGNGMLTFLDGVVGPGATGNSADYNKNNGSQSGTGSNTGTGTGSNTGTGTGNQTGTGNNTGTGTGTGTGSGTGSGQGNTNQGPSGSYVLNTRIHVAHTPDCKYIQNAYRQDVMDTVANLRAQGYSSCNACHPW